jgi:hypothetical protein
MIEAPNAYIANPCNIELSFLLLLKLSFFLQHVQAFLFFSLHIQALTYSLWHVQAFSISLWHAHVLSFSFIHRMTYTHTALGVTAIRFCLGSWSLVSRVWTLCTHFWKHYIIEIFLEGGMQWKVFLGCQKRFLETFCSKVIFIFSSFLMLHVAYYITWYWMGRMFIVDVNRIML